ncbi:hypothetical protein TNCV_3372061 [Trichonephila clavipes]|nr:hypothetical protein TNCV_3372061 [Trichonephila clavipes]
MRWKKTQQLKAEIEKIVNLARQISLEGDGDDIQELLDSQNRELTMDELIEMHRKEKYIEEELFQSEDGRKPDRRSQFN